MQELESDAGVECIKIAESIKVADLGRLSVVRIAASYVVEARKDGLAKIVTALHVGGLNERSTPGFLEGLRRARLVYADGIAVVLLAKLMGAKSVERAATTDIGVPILKQTSRILNRDVRVALVGGSPGLAEEAARSLAGSAPIDVVYTCHGFQSEDEWHERLQELREESPDVIFVGLGSPKELLFCVSNMDRLPSALVLTCGGWFGFLSGAEPRAPRIIRAMGLEWANRLMHDPRRLTTRYAKGLLTFVSLASTGVARRGAL